MIIGARYTITLPIRPEAASKSPEETTLEKTNRQGLAYLKNQKLLAFTSETLGNLTLQLGYPNDCEAHC